MGQIYPTPSSFGQSVTINTSAPLTGGGPVSLGGSLTLGLSTSDSSTRRAYVVTPNPNGTIANFTIVGLPPGSDVSYADVFVDGVLQFTSTFTLSGATLSLNTPPVSGQKIRVVCSTPADNRQQYTLVASSSTVFTFPSVSPQSTYVDVYDGNGKLQIVGTSGYYLDITNGSYSVIFASAPVVPIIAVFDPSVNSGRNLYTTTSISSTTFTIPGGSPSTSYIDVFDQGLFLMDGSSYDYTLTYSSGVWVITFAAAPVSPVAVFAPATVVPPSQSIGSVVNTLNGLSGAVVLAAGTNIALTPTGNTITIAATASGGLPTNNPTFTGTITGPHYAANGSTPSIVPLPGLGTGGTASVVGNDTRGTITLVTGIPNATGGLATLTFSTAYGSTPNVQLTAGDNITSQSLYATSPSTTGFTVSVNSTTIPRITFTIYYFVIG